MEKERVMLLAFEGGAQCPTRSPACAHRPVVPQQRDQSLRATDFERDRKPRWRNRLLRIQRRAKVARVRHMAERLLEDEGYANDARVHCLNCVQGYVRVRIAKVEKRLSGSNASQNSAAAYCT